MAQRTRQDAIDFLTLKQGSEQHIEYLETLTDEQLHILCQYTDNVVEHHLHGLDKMMNSMIHSMKYIPNVFMQMMAKKYVDPIFSARLTQKMRIKDIVALTKGMPAEYVAEVTAHQEDDKLSAEIMRNMKPKDINPVLKIVCDKHPFKALDIAEHLDDKLLRLAAKNIQNFSPKPEQMTEARERTLQRLIALK